MSSNNDWTVGGAAFVPSAPSSLLMLLKVFTRM
jgi:hypothetical protein